MMQINSCVIVIMLYLGHWQVMFTCYARDGQWWLLAVSL